MKIYVLGNPLVKEDSNSLMILSDLKKALPKIYFEIADPNENFPPKDERNIMILDTVFGLKKPTIFDLDDFKQEIRNPISPHDYDLLIHLLLLKKLKKINKVIIIGIPDVIRDKLKLVNWIIEQINYLLKKKYFYHDF